MNEKILRILELCLEITPPDVPYDQKSGKPVVFFNYSGHCNFLDVHIHENGWNYHEQKTHKPTKKFECFLKCNSEEKVKELEDVIKYLEALVRKCKSD